MKSKKPENPFEIVEVEVFDDDFEAASQDSGFDSEAAVSIPNQERSYEEGYEDEQSYQRRRRRRSAPVTRKTRKNKYGWAFFVSSMFIGVGLTASMGHPLPLFLGMGVGFLFFVDPIYEKVMEKIENL
ncbi:MAG: hypothetical protein AAFR61_23020 [Bacteroidota bacterium]